MEEEFSLNLDVMDSDELEEASIALTILGRYASRKADAVRARLAGAIASAEKHERIAERIYKELPVNYRW